MSDQLPPGWTWAKVREIGTVQLGRQRSPDVHRGTNMRPYLRVANVFEDRIDLEDVMEMHFEPKEIERYQLKEGDILLNEGQSRELVGRPAMYRGELPGACFTNSLVRFQASELVDRDFALQLFRHWLKNGRFQSIAQITTNIAHLGAGRFAEMELPLPPLNEQRRIVAKLEPLQARSRRAREALDAVPALLEKLRQSILAAAFRGDLTKDWREKHKDIEPAARLIERTPLPKGRSSGRAASTAVRPGLAAIAVGNPGLSAPSTWEWVALARVARMESGHTPSREHPEYWNGPIPWVGIKDAREACGKEIRSTFQTVTELGLANSAARLLPGGTVCLSRTASVGYVTVMGKPMATSQDFANWICSDALLPNYLMFALLAEGEHIRTFGEGTTHTTIYFPELKALHICLPPIEEQREIVRLVRRHLDQVQNLADIIATQRANLALLEQSILARAFRGELVPQNSDDEPVDAMLARISPLESRQRGPQKRPTGLRTT